MLAGPDPKDLATKWQPPVTLDNFDNFDDLNRLKMGIYAPYFEVRKRDNKPLL